MISIAISIMTNHSVSNKAKVILFFYEKTGSLPNRSNKKEKKTDISPKYFPPVHPSITWAHDPSLIGATGGLGIQ